MVPVTFGGSFRSYDQNLANMKSRYHLALATFLPLMAMAQTDTTRVDTTTGKGDDGHYMGVFLNQGGLTAEVGRYDTLKKDEPDTLRFETRRKTYTIITERRAHLDTAKFNAEDRTRSLNRQRRNLFTYWSGLDLGLNNWVGPSGSMDLDSASKFMELNMARSRFFAINFMEQKIEFGSHHAGLMTGMGLEFTSYHLSNNYILAYDEDSTYGVKVASPEFQKNKLRQIGLRVPLMLEFNTGSATTKHSGGALKDGRTWNTDQIERKNNFHIAMGLVSTLYFDTMYKRKYKENGEMQKDRSGGNYNLLPYRVAASVRLGWNSLNLFAEYSLTPLFRNDRGPELTPVNFGITLVGFN
jgi:hypothetical protein